MAYIHINPFKTSYLAAQQELQQRKTELQFVTQRIAQLEDTIRTLEPLANEEGVAPTAGLPELCRQILMSQPGAGFTAPQVMEHLAAMGVDISGYAQPLAILHTTLSRICRPGTPFVKSQSFSGQATYLYDESRKVIRRFPRLNEGR
jgi:hypothetical protein